MRRYDARRQQEGETLAEFEQALRTLYREAWPTAAEDKFKDSSLKRKFEQCLLDPELVQHLRLHARDCNFEQTVEKARVWQDAREQTRPKKSIRLAEPVEHAVAPDPQVSQSTYLFYQMQKLQETVDRLDHESQANVNCTRNAATGQEGQGQSSGPRRNRPPPGQRRMAPPTPSQGSQDGQSGGRGSQDGRSQQMSQSTSDRRTVPVSYTHLTLPTNREV